MCGGNFAVSAAALSDARRDQLLACLRWDEAGDLALASLGARDWQDLMSLIVEGGGHALLARRLARPGHCAAPPDAVTAALRSRQRAIATRIFASLALLLECLNRVKRPLLFLKGVDLAHRVYGDLGARSMSDIDLLAHPDDVMAFHEALSALGFKADAPPSAARQAEELWSQTSYEPPSRGVYALDLHWRLGKREAEVERDMDTAAIWRRAVPHPGLNRPDALVMAPEDMLLYLCLHLRHHTFDSPLTQVWDIAEVLEWAERRGFDWDAFWSRAEAWRLTRTAALAFRQAHDTLGVAVPAAPQAATPAEVASLLPNVLPNLGRHRNHERVAEPHVAALFAPAIPLTVRLRQIGGRIFPPRAEVAARFGLPEGAWTVWPHYLVYWRRQIRDHGHFVFSWLSGDRGMRVQSDRIAGLSLWLEQGPDR